MFFCVRFLGFEVWWILYFFSGTWTKFEFFFYIWAVGFAHPHPPPGGSAPRPPILQDLHFKIINWLASTAYVAKSRFAASLPKRDMMWYEILCPSLSLGHCASLMSIWPLLREDGGEEVCISFVVTGPKFVGYEPLIDIINLNIYHFIQVSILLLDTKAVVSFIRLISCKQFKHSAKLLIYTRNNRGTRTVLCGTPWVIIIASEFVPLTVQYCFISDRWDVNHLWWWPRIPMWHNVLNMKLWNFTYLKILDMTNHSIDRDWDFPGIGILQWAWRTVVWETGNPRHNRDLFEGPRKPLKYHCIMIQRGLKGALIRLPLCREA